MFADKYFNLILVIVIALLLLYQQQYMAYFANTSLGKIIAIILITYYTSINTFYGLFVCSLIVFYYQYIFFNNSAIYAEKFTNIQANKPIAVKEFKEQNCKNGVLVHKGSPIHPEMMEHIYPDIEFKYEACNLCLDTCEFSIMEEQFKAEESLKPKTSDDFSIDKLLGKISDFIPAMRVKSEPFASFE